MTTFNEQLKKQADGIRMRSAEKRELRERIVAYMEYHPLPESIKVKAVKRSVRAVLPKAVASESFFIFNFNPRFMQSAAVLGTLLFVVGVPALAERSLPGDILYPMKVMVNEEVRSTLAFSPYAKVEWEAARLERRLSEARLLAQEGRLTEDAERKVAEAVKEHSDTAQETILALRETDTEGAALAEIAFASVLEAQADIITLHEEQARLASDGEGSVVSGTVLALAVQDARSAAASAREEGRVTPERLFALIERETTYAQELFESIENDTTEQEAKNIARRLGDIGRKVERAQALQVKLAEMSVPTAHADEGVATSTSTEEAALMVAAASAEPVLSAADVASLLRTALTDTRKLISFMTDIEVRHSVDVERLIPITLTDEERMSAIQTMLTNVRAIQADASQREIGGGAVVAKLERGLAEIARLVAQAEAALAEHDIDAAEMVAIEAEAYANDIRGVVMDSPLKPNSTSTASTTTGSTTSTPPVVDGTATSTTSTTPVV